MSVNIPVPFSFVSDASAVTGLIPAAKAEAAAAIVVSFIKSRRVINEFPQAFIFSPNCFMLCSDFHTPSYRATGNAGAGRLPSAHRLLRSNLRAWLELLVPAMIVHIEGVDTGFVAELYHPVPQLRFHYFFL